MNPAPFCTICLPIISPFLLNLSLTPWSRTQKWPPSHPQPFPTTGPRQGRWRCPGLAAKGHREEARPFYSPHVGGLISLQSPGAGLSEEEAIQLYPPNSSFFFQRDNAVLSQMSHPVAPPPLFFLHFSIFS